MAVTAPIHFSGNPEADAFLGESPLALMIGFCVVVGFTKLKRTSGGVMVIKSLDEQMTHKPMEYLMPGDPRGPADQLHSPELVEAAARK